MVHFTQDLLSDIHISTWGSRQMGAGAAMSLRPVFNSYSPVHSRRLLGHFSAPRRCLLRRQVTQTRTIARGWRWEESETSDESFDAAVDMFNERNYYNCHDILEALWNEADEPQRTLLHALLQTSVGLYHLLNQNHRGAMVELGEGVAKLGKLKLKEGPFCEFYKEIRSVLGFIYNTQLENAACNDEFCITMDGSQENYQLLGNFGAGEDLYRLEQDGAENAYNLVFSPATFDTHKLDTSVKLPKLHASQVDLNHL